MPLRSAWSAPPFRWKTKWVTLSPGMALSVEIKTGQCLLIEFFFSPLLKYGQESIRER